MIFRAKAPLRLSFAGGGTDIPPFCEQEGGCVLSATIDKYAWGSIWPRTDGQTVIQSVDLGPSIDLASTAVKRWCPKPDTKGITVFLHSDVPPGSGLGASSALAVCLEGLFCRHKGYAATEYEIARAAHTLERIELGIPGGYQDHYASTFGGFNFIKFCNGTVSVWPLRLKSETINELEHNLLLCYLGTTRNSGEVIEDQVSRYSTGISLESLRMQKKYVGEMCDALMQGDLNTFGVLLGEAWLWKKKLSDKITTGRADEMYEEAIRCGALGGKMPGAGGGGHMLFYCQFEKKHKVAEALVKLGGSIVPFVFEHQGLQTWKPVAAELVEAFA